MLILRQSTAVEVPIGPLLDSTDGNTAESGLTITQPDIRLKKNGAAWAQKSAAQTLSHEENGWYEVSLSATDTDTVGHLIVAVHESGALPVWREFQVVEEAVYDALFASGATGALPVSSGGIASTAFATGAITATAIASNAITDAKIADGALTAAKFAAGAFSAVWSVTTRTLSTISGLASEIRAALGLASANLDTQLETIDANVDAVLEDTGTTLPAAIGTIDGNVDAIKAVTDALPDGGALSSLATAAALATVDGNVDAVKAVTDKLDTTLEDQGAGTYGFTEAALQEAPTGAGSGATAQEVWEYETRTLTANPGLDAAGVRTAVGLASANLDTQLSTIDAVVDAILVDTAEIGPAGAGLTEAGGTGDHLTAVPWNAAWDAEVQSEAADALAAYDPPTNAEMTARTLAAADYATATALTTVDTVVDAIKGTTDKLDTALELDGAVYRYTTNALENAPSGGGGGTSDWTSGEKEQIRHRLGIDGDAASPSATPSLATAAALSAVDGKIDTIDGNVDAILEDTSTTLQAELDGIQAATEDIQSRLPAALVSGRIDASVGGMQANTVTAAALASDAVTEIQSGLATASALTTVDTVVDSIKAVTDALPDALATVDGNVDAILEDTGTTIPGLIAGLPGDILDLANGVETSITPRQALRLILAAAAGKISGAGTTTITIRNVGDTKTRITATTDSAGNRSAVTTDVT